MEKVIRMVRIGGEVYLRRSDIITLIEDYQRQKADSINAKAVFGDLLGCLKEGIEGHKNRKEEGD